MRFDMFYLYMKTLMMINETCNLISSTTSLLLFSFKNSVILVTIKILLLRCVQLITNKNCNNFDIDLF